MTTKQPSGGVSWRILWGGLVFAAAALFAIFEGVALRDPAPGDTLSEGVWTLTGPVGTFRWAVTAGPLGGFLTWLAIHFVFQVWGWKALLVCIAAGAAAAILLTLGTHVRMEALA